MDVFGAIRPGWEVVGSDGDQIGTVHIVGDGYLQVEKGLFFIKDVFVPRSAVSDADPDARRVRLNVTRDAVGDMGWTEPPVRTRETNVEAARTWGQGTIDDARAATRAAGAAGPDAGAANRDAGPRAYDAPAAPPGATARGSHTTPVESPADAGLVGAGTDRMSGGSIEEPADDFAASRVPRETIEQDSVAVWSEPAGDEPPNELPGDDEPRPLT